VLLMDRLYVFEEELLEMGTEMESSHSERESSIAQSLSSEWSVMSSRRVGTQIGWSFGSL
jgi:hypothetical protein